jgi:hypothetical protein
LLHLFTGNNDKDVDNKTKKVEKTEDDGSNPTETKVTPKGKLQQKGGKRKEQISTDSTIINNVKGVTKFGNGHPDETKLPTKKNEEHF